MSDQAEKTGLKTANARRPQGLGRGLSALMGDVVREVAVQSDNNDRAASATIQMIEIAAIQPHPDQPRRHFSETALSELAESIQQRGIIQPILVRPMGKGFQLVAGERRWRAAQRAGLHQIPAVVRTLEDAETLEIALVENIQREDLNAIEEAEAYARLIQEFSHSQARLAQIVGKSRSHVANLLRLLDLPERVREFVRSGELQMGHARAMIGAPDPTALAKQAIAENLSVRQVERRMRAKMAASRNRSQPNGAADADIRAIESHLADLLGLKVKIAANADGAAGSMTIAFANLDQLDLICQRLTGERI
ncbi:MAG: ParB/RepB/Spo0J family partition protein [Parasphingorhabdus sp.]|nr:ParB/RepB/Spo0J family partition protein [Parasphingorhabdus sp.]